MITYAIVLEEGLIETIWLEMNPNLGILIVRTLDGGFHDVRSFRFMFDNNAIERMKRDAMTSDPEFKGRCIISEAIGYLDLLDGAGGVLQRCRFIYDEECFILGIFDGYTGQLIDSVLLPDGRIIYQPDVSDNGLTISEPFVRLLCYDPAISLLTKL